MSVQFLSSAAILALHDGQLPPPWTMSGRAGAGPGLQGQRLAISELVRMAMMNIALHPSWEILHTPGVTNPTAALQKDWNGWISSGRSGRPGHGTGRRRN